MSLHIDIVTLFPQFFSSPLQESILKRAQDEEKVTIHIHNLRDWTQDRHKTVDDKPFGGGAGMVLKPEPLDECLESLGKGTWKVLLDPHGKPMSQEKAKELSGKKRIVLIAGHYEGVDYRVKEHLIDEEISVGDFVTMGGEAPALCVTEAIVRLLPGVLGNEASSQEESFQSGLLEYPQYTRPRNYKGWEVPETLISGNHKEIQSWRKKKAKEITLKRRPDLIE